MQDIEARLVRLEQAVFGARGGERGAPPTETDLGSLAGLMIGLRPWGENLAEGDRLVMQFVLSGREGEIRGQVSSLHVLRDEEDDEGVARLCSVLASRQRISIIKHLTRASMTNGELAEATGMAGGHLHHHLRDLISLSLVEKHHDGRYLATEAGINTYLTVAALHRRLTYDDRTLIQMNLPGDDSDSLLEV